MKKHWVWPLLMMSLVWGSAFGAIEAQDFPSEAVKTRYYDLIAMLRCPQCLILFCMSRGGRQKRGCFG